MSLARLSASTSRQRVRRLTLLVMVLAAAATAVVPVTGASAHAALESTSPASGAVVASSPDQVVLVFGEQIQSVGDGIVVTSPSDARVDTGRTAVSGDKATQPLRRLTESGAYTVRFRIVSADGHVVSSSYGFTYRPGTASPAPTAAPVAAATASSGSAAMMLVAGGATAAVLVGALAVRRRRSTRGDDA